MKYKCSLLILIVCISPFVTLSAISNGGRVCISPINNQNFYDEDYLFKMSGAKPPIYSIQIDEGKIVSVGFDDSIIYPSISRKVKHLVKIWRNETLFQSFWFTFNDYDSNELCLWHKARYETWALWKLNESKHFCTCTK